MFNKMFLILINLNIIENLFRVNFKIYLKND